MIQVDSKHFRQAVDEVAPIAGANRSMLNLQHVHISATGTTLTLSAMNPDGYAERTVRCESEGDVRLLLPNRLLSIFSKGVQKSSVSIEPDDKGGAKLVCGPSKARLPGLEPQDFPCPPSWDGASVIFEGDLSDFRSVAGRVAPCAIFDPKSHRNALKCVSYRVQDGRSEAAAANSYMLGISSGTGMIDGSWLFPAPFVQALPDEKGTLSRLVDGRYAARGEGWARTHSSLDLGAEFVAYEKAIPKDIPLRISVMRSELASAIGRVRAMSEDEIVAIVLTPGDDGLKVTLRDSKDGRTAEETVDASICEGPSVAADARWFALALSVLSGDEARISYQSSFSPVLFEGADEARAVVQPLKVVG